MTLTMEVIMGRFSEPLHYERLSDRWVVLLEDLHFYFTLKTVMGGNTKELRKLLAATGLKEDQTLHVTAPRGFVTDLASVPPSLQWIFSPDGEYAKAAIIHDMIYQSLKGHTFQCPSHSGIERLNYCHTQLLADRIFLCGMRTLGVGAVSRSVMYRAVRMFGDSSYGGAPMEEDYQLVRLLRGTPRADMYPIFREDLTDGVPERIRNLKTQRWDYHAVKYPNLKRAFVYPTV